MRSGNKSLIDRVEDFARYVAWRQFQRGSLLFVTLVGIVIFVVVLLEYIGNFNSWIRASLLYGSLGFVLLAAWHYVIRHLLSAWGIRQRMSAETASEWIGSRLDEVGDSLTNAIQLYNEPSALAQRSVQIKEESLHGVDFRAAVQQDTLLRYYLAFVLAVVILGSSIRFFPEVWKTGSNRLWKYEVPFHQMAPFQAFILSDTAEVIEDSYTLKFQLRGEQVPGQAAVLVGGKTLQTQRESDVFEVTLQPESLEQEWYIQAGKYRLGPFALHLRKKPTFNLDHVRITYPEYLGQEPDTLGYTRYLEVPEGSEVTYGVQTTEEAALWARRKGSEKAEDMQTLFWKVQETVSYSVEIRNAYWVETVIDSAVVRAIQDEHPRIAMRWEQDETNPSLITVSLDVSDDYGLRDLSMEVTQQSAGQALRSIRTLSGTGAQVTYQFDFAAEPGLERVRFRVRDNDARHGFKQSFSGYIEWGNMKSQERQEALERLKAGVSEWSSLEEKQAKLPAESFEQERAQEPIRNMQKLLEELEKKTEMRSPNQQRLEDLQKLLEDLVEQQEDKQPQEPEEQQQQQKMNQRTMKLVENWLKQLYKEEKRDQLADKLEEVAEDRVEDSDESESEENDSEGDEGKDKEGSEDQQEGEKQEASEEKQNEASTPASEKEKLEEQYEEWKKEWEKYDSTLTDWEMDDQEQQELDQDADDIQQEMKESSPNQKSNNQQMQQTRQQMKELSQKMKSSLNSSDKKAYEENYQNIRMLHENVLALSFDEETIYNQGLGMSQNEPGWKALRVEQSTVLDDWEVVKDSLYALGARVDMLLPVIQQGVTKVEENGRVARKALSSADNQQLQNASRTMMTGLNDLALLLAEALNQMQMQMKSSSPSDGQCEKPGQGNPKKQNNGMKQALQELKRGMKESQGEQKKGKTGKKEGQGKGELQMMKAAEQLREAVRDLKTLSQEGKEQINRELDKLEDEILEDRISLETEKRLEQLEVKLLEWERAEQEQEQEERRESKSADLYQEIRDQRFREYLQRDQQEREWQRWSTPRPERYYQGKITRYNGSMLP